MLPSLKSDFRKLFTVRSTYIMSCIVLALVVLICFYFEGYRGNTGSSASTLAPTAIKEIISNTAGTGALFVAIIAVLFMAHEYRYNMITYTLTANTRRTKVLLSKIIAIVIFGIVFGILTSATGIGLYMLGLQLRDASLPAQDFDVWTQFGKVAIYYGAYALIGLFIATLVRGVVGAIAVLLLFPTAIESTLGLVLKEKAAYLPFAATDTIMGASMIQGNALTSNGAIGVTAIYLVIVGIVTWLLFLRRDAV
jgi:ABC-2 type transport system permease protein